MDLPKCQCSNSNMEGISWPLWLMFNAAPGQLSTKPEKNCITCTIRPQANIA